MVRVICEVDDDVDLLMAAELEILIRPHIKRRAVLDKLPSHLITETTRIFCVLAQSVIWQPRHKKRSPAHAGSGGAGLLDFYSRSGLKRLAGGAAISNRLD